MDKMTMADRVLVVLASTGRFTSTRRIQNVLDSGQNPGLKPTSERTVSGALARLRDMGVVRYVAGMGWKWAGIDKLGKRLRRAEDDQRAAELEAASARAALKKGTKVKLRELARHGLTVQLVEVRR